MTAREKTTWLLKRNPYKQRYMWDAWREGARAYWAGAPAMSYGEDGYTLLAPREVAAFHKGYEAAQLHAEDASFESYDEQLARWNG